MDRVPPCKEIEKVERSVSFAQRIASEKWWRPTCLAVEADQTWHSLPLVGVEQRCGSAALTVGHVPGGNLCLVPILDANADVDACSF